LAENFDQRVKKDELIVLKYNTKGRKNRNSDHKQSESR
jgi:hypothetical protein